MRYVVAYDIEDDRVRTRIADVLQGYGARVQKSVFECLVESDELDRLTRRLQAELETSPGGDIRFYRTCASCLEVSFGIGEVAEGLGGEPWIVV